MRDIFKTKPGGINTLLKSEFNAGTNKFTFLFSHFIISHYFLISLFLIIFSFHYFSFHYFIT